MAKREWIDSTEIYNALLQKHEDYNERYCEEKSIIISCELKGRASGYYDAMNMVELATFTESKIVKPYLERLKERLTKKKPTYNPPQITYDAGVFDALELSISEIDTMLSELKKGSGE